MIIMNCLRGLFIFLFFLISTTILAQIPTDLSKLKASQISNTQLQQYLAQAKDRGLTNDQVETELLQRGFPESEMAELRLRIQQLNPVDTKTETNNEVNQVNQDTRRKSPQTSNNPLLNIQEEKTKSPKTLKVSPDGTINVKYAGVINVSGLTIEGATSVLKNRLTKYYPALRSGQTKLELALGNIRSIRVILIGAVNRPGTYTLPSLANLFNALYVSGGPTENGSFRNIELIRNNRVVEVADLYDFLLKGDLSSNVRLEDNDVIRVPFATNMITLTGQLNRPGIFELKQHETLQDAVSFAGGFKSKAFKGRITGNRFSDFDKSVIDVSGDSLKVFEPRNGDEYFIDSVVNRYQNRVIISGAVFKPGPYD